MNPSFRYRAYHPVLLHQKLHQTIFCHLDEVYDCIKGAFEFRVTFIRPYYSRALVKLLGHLDSKNIAYFADYDDLIFSPVHVSDLPLMFENPSIYKALLKQTEGYYNALGRFSLISVSTQSLKSKLLECHPSASVIVSKNQLPPDSLINQSCVRTKPDSAAVYYCSGTKSHQVDLESIVAPLGAWLDAGSSRELVLVGAIDIPIQLKHKRVKKLSSCHYLSLPLVMSQASIAIAPLIKSSFNHCKSATKYLESAQIGLPVIASNIGEYAQLDGGGPLLVEKDEQWLHHLTRLTKDAEFWCSESARQQEGALTYGSNSTRILPAFRDHESCC